MEDVREIPLPEPFLPGDMSVEKTKTEVSVHELLEGRDEWNCCNSPGPDGIYLA